MENQIINCIERYARENVGCIPNQKSLESVRQNADAFNRLVSDQHYLMKAEINEDKACIVQFTSEEGAVYTTYTFFNAILAAK